MKRLAPKEHWTANAYYANPRFRLGRFIPKSFPVVHFEHIIKRHVKAGQSILEIGVAPGLRLVELAKRFELDPFGLDYSQQGAVATRANFRAAGYNPRNVMQADLFDAAFRKRHAGRFDIVYSAGFIEHFDDITTVLEYHRQFAKPGGLVIVTIPNLKLLSCFIPKSLLALHNRSIMYPAVLRASLPKKLVHRASGYYGGIANIGLLYAQNRLIETLRLCLYALQRLTLDQLQRVLLALHVTVQHPQTTPDIFLIARNGTRRNAVR